MKQSGTSTWVTTATTHEDDGASVIPTSLCRLQTEGFVKDALTSFLNAGFSSDNSIPERSSPLLSGRTSEDAASDISKIVAGASLSSTTSSLARQESALKEKTDRYAASLAEPIQSVTAAGPQTWTCERAIIEPYLVQLRAASEKGLSVSDRLAQNARRDSTNAAVALAEIGKTSKFQHPAALRIAEEFGLNKLQRLAFYSFANGLLAQQQLNPPEEALRLYIGGGEGTGKSHVLKAIKAFMECPAINQGW